MREVEVFPSQQLDLYFIPTKAGTFGLDCAIAGHHEAGMFGTITVSGSDLEQLTCARPTGAMRVMSSPAGAAVFVDGINIGAAPATYNAIPGEHTVQCELSGYTSSTVAVTITIGSTTEVDCDLQRIIKRSSGGGGGGGSSKRITAINVTNNTAAVPPVNTETAPPAPPVDKLPTSDATSGEGAAVTASDAQAQNELQGSTARAPNSEQESPSALTGAVTGEPSESTQGIKWRYVYYALGAAVILGAAALVFRARRLKRRQA